MTPQPLASQDFGPDLHVAPADAVPPPSQDVLGIPLAAAGLLSPVIAGAAMAASSVSVVGNALLLRKWRP